MRLDGDPEDMFFSVGLEVSGSITFAMANDIGDAWNENLAEITPSEYRLASVDLVSSTGEIQIFAPNFAGTSSASALPQNVALLVRKFTGQTGRKNRGRIFYPGAQREAVNELGEIDLTSLENFQNAFTAFGQDLIAITDVEGVVILHADASEPTPVVAMVVDGRVATQRRRLRP